jgi:hypothetical protein
VDAALGEGSSFAADVLDGRDPLRDEILSEEALDEDRLFSIIRGNHKYILRTHPAESRALYDLAEDPAELVNLVDSRPDLARPMAATLDEYRNAVESGFRLVCVASEPRLASGAVRTGSPVTRVSAENLKKAGAGSHGLSEDRTTLWFRIPADGELRGLAFELEDPRQAFHLSIEPDTRGSWSVFVADEHGPRQSDHLEIDAGQFSGRRQSDEIRAIGDGCFIWRQVRPGDDRSLAVDTATRNQLEALGYLE